MQSQGEPQPDQIFVTNITNYIRGKKLSCGEISAFHVWQLWGNWKFLHMWRNFRCLHMTDVEKSEILHIWHVCDVENVAIYAKFIAIYAVLLLNLLFTLFCREISCGEKLSPKVHFWRKNDKYGVCSQTPAPDPSIFLLPSHSWKVENGHPFPPSFCSSFPLPHPSPSAVFASAICKENNKFEIRELG